MHRLIPRNRTLRQLETPEVLNWLRIARKRGYASAILDLEIELSTRKVWKDAFPEAAFQLGHIADPDRRAAIALARLQKSAALQAINYFHENLWNLDPTNFTHAWLLARSFKHDGTRAEALIHVSYCIACYFKGPDEAASFIAEKTEDKSPEEIIVALEEQFGKLIDQSPEVQNA
jgi:hypothetical protein